MEAARLYLDGPLRHIPAKLGESASRLSATQPCCLVAPRRALCRALCAALVLLGLLLAQAPALAQSRANPSTPARRYSAYEAERVQRALARVNGKIDAAPGGKRIESIEVVALPVFEPEDAAPQFLNWFHVTTREYVIEREVLFRVGSRFDQRRSDETERNLRSLLLFSVVLTLPVQGSRPDSIRYVVVTKDVWSLRLGWDGRVNQGVIDSLSLQPTERNLFGTGRQLFGTLNFGRRAYSIGAGFLEPRLAGSRTRILVRGAVVFDCSKGSVEGSSGAFEYSRPLYSSRTNWGYGVSVSWSNGRNPLRTTGSAAGSICSQRSGEELQVELPSGRLALIPNQYSYDTQSFRQYVTRSYGYRYKTDLSFGLEASRVAYGAVDLSHVRAGPSEVSAELTPEEVAWARLRYARFIAPSDRRYGPFFELLSYTTDFHRDINSETLALQEDVARLGHVASLRLYPSLRAVGSSRNFLGIRTNISHTSAVGTGYLRLRATHDVEFGRVEETDATLSLAFRFTSPRLPLGRFVYDTRLTDHYRNYTRTNLWLGSTNRLRGYRNPGPGTSVADTARVGDHLFVSNLEFRTRPIQIFSAQLALVLFHDMGDAFDSFGEADVVHGVGAGIRFLAPQLDRDVFRIDFGLPVPLDEPGGETTVIATFGQAFGLP